MCILNIFPRKTNFHVLMPSPVLDVAKGTYGNVAPLLSFLNVVFNPNAKRIQIPHVREEFFMCSNPICKGQDYGCDSLS